MCVQHRPSLMGVQRRVDEEPRRLHPVLALQDPAGGLGQHERRGSHLRPQQPVRVDQEPLTADDIVIVGHGHREVVVHTLVESQPVPRRRLAWSEPMTRPRS